MLDSHLRREEQFIMLVLLVKQKTCIWQTMAFINTFFGWFGGFNEILKLKIFFYAFFFTEFIISQWLRFGWPTWLSLKIVWITCTMKGLSAYT